jgi:predicted PurR-regulated permease PerM
MKDPAIPETQQTKTALAIETTIRIGLIAIIVVWCFEILKPFLLPMVWGLIIAVALYPAYRWLLSKIGRRPKTAAAVLAGGLLVFVILAGALTINSLVAGLSGVRESLTGDFEIPPAPGFLLTWPVIGKPIVDTWEATRSNLGRAVSEFAPQLKVAALWLLGSAMSVGAAFLMFVLSTIISGVFLATSESGAKAARDIGRRLLGDRGDEFVRDAEVTVRNVAIGVLGVASIQAVLAGLGFALAGVPAAGLWMLLCIFFSVIQIGIGPVAIPIAIYMFYSTDTTTASLLAVWLAFCLVIDNVLKPLLLGRNAPVPMLIVFLGSIGGFLLSGIIGLFIGAVVLSLGYKLFLAWLREVT